MQVAVVVARMSLLQWYSFWRASRRR